MATDHVSNSRIAIAILAKAPLPGFAKTRLIPSFGAVGAARLQRELTLQTLRTVFDAGLGSVSLCCTPDPQQRFFRAIARAFRRNTGQNARLSFHRQTDGDLGQRMTKVFADATEPLLLVGTDCPALTAAHLSQAARVLDHGADAVLIPAEDGGYVLIGLRRCVPEVFECIDWGTDQVLGQTRERMRAAGLRWEELETLWDVDRVADVERWRVVQAASAPRRK